MRPSRPPSGNDRYVRGPDHDSADRNRALVPAAGNPRTLSGMPVSIGSHIISFYPDSARALTAASRMLQRFSAYFLESNAREIGALCSPARSTLYSLVHNCFIQYRMNLESESQPNRAHILFHHSVSTYVGLLGGQCPLNRIPSSQEIGQFNQTIENDHLSRIWRATIHNQVLTANPALQGVPAIDASAQDIRNWMRTGENQPVLRGIVRLELQHLDLTCVPTETGLFTRLQCLSLANNRLASLQEGAFQGLISLQTLELDNNQLDSLPKGLFRGLTSLQTLSLNDNRLASLPEWLFQGLTSLQTLQLYNNQLDSLPKGLFRGLTSLQTLSLNDNRLASLPERLFRG